MDDQNNNSQDSTQSDADAANSELMQSQAAEAVSNESTDSSPAAQNDNSENPFTALKNDQEEIALEEAPRNDEESEAIETAPSETEEPKTEEPESENREQKTDDSQTEPTKPEPPANPNARWYVVHTFAGHENKVATALRQRIEAEHLENLIYDILVPTQDKIEIKGGRKETVKEKIFPGYILIKMELSDLSWLAVRTTQGVTSFIGAANKPTPISEAEVASIVKFTTQGASPTFKDVFMVDDTVKIIDGPFAEFIGKVDSVDKEKGRVRVLVSIFGRETPVELDFLQVQKL